VCRSGEGAEDTESKKGFLHFKFSENTIERRGLHGPLPRATNTAIPSDKRASLRVLIDVAVRRSDGHH
jgi:hypothetical protein